MKVLAVLGAIFAAGFSGCGPDCAIGPNIQVTVVSSFGVNNAAIASLHIVMSVDGMQPRTVDIMPKSRIDTRPVTLLLLPDPPPADRYNLAITVQALDGAGDLIGIGSAAGDMVAQGCNRLLANLAPLGVVVGDGGVTLPDLSSTDMANCISVAGQADEDQDTRSDICDLCPADPDTTPTDADLDGLPDACDPDPARPGNQALYFEPFNAANTGFSTGLVSQGFLKIDTNGTNGLVSTQTTQSLPPTVRVQTQFSVPMPGFYTAGGGIFGDVGILLVDSTSPAANGMMCAMVRDTQNGDRVAIYPLSGGNFGTPTSQPLPDNFQQETKYRLRLTQRGGVYTCEAFSPGFVPRTVTRTVQTAPDGPLFISLHAQAAEAHFHNVVAESALP
jgi:hypothetical protein